MSDNFIGSAQGVLNVTAAAATHTSAAFKIDASSFFSYQVIWANGAGGPTASVTVQVSNSADQDIVRGTADWTALTISGPPSISGNSGSLFINLELKARYTRIVVAFSAGNADLRVNVAGGNA